MADENGIPHEAHLSKLEDAFAARGGEIFRTVINFPTTITRLNMFPADEDSLRSLGAEELVLVESPIVKGLPGTIAFLLDKAFTARIVDFMIMGEGDVEFMPDEHLDGIVEAVNQLLGNELTELGTQLGVSLRNEIQSARLIGPDELVETFAGWILVSFDVAIEGHEDARLVKLLSPDLAEKLGQMLAGAAEGGAAPAESDSGEAVGTEGASDDPFANLEVGGPESAPAAGSKQVKQVKQAAFTDFGKLPARETPGMENRLTDSGLARVLDLRLPVVIELGRTRMLIKDIVELSPGAVIELNKLVGEPVDLYVNGTCFAQGEVVVIDENFGVRITELVPLEDRIKTAEEAS